MQIKSLNDIISQDVDTIIKRTRNHFLNVTKVYGESYVLFGAGLLGKLVLNGLRSMGIEPLGFADNNSSLWGKIIDGLPVYPPQNAADIFRNKAIFVVTVYTNQSVIKQLRRLGVESVSFAKLAWHYPNAMLPHCALNLPHQIFQEADQIRKAFLLWSDHSSQEEFIIQLKWRTSLEGEEMPLHLPADQIYFPLDILTLQPNESFVDCGAFDGDSSFEFMKLSKNQFNMIWAIEPDPLNFDKLRNKFAQLDKSTTSKIKILNIVIGSEREKVTFNVTGTVTSSLGKGKHTLESTTLDNILEGTSPTYIKMDIEGAELRALNGAKNVIKNNLPILAICAYHQQDHLWKIPLLIKSISDQYKFFLRRYADECWELVCYAIPKERLRI